MKVLILPCLIIFCKRIVQYIISLRGRAIPFSSIITEKILIKLSNKKILLYVFQAKNSLFSPLSVNVKNVKIMIQILELFLLQLLLK